VSVAFGVSYFGTRDPRHVREDLDEIAAAGFTAVTHTFSEHDLRHHAANVAAIVLATRSRGLEAGLDPWGVAGLFGGEAYSELALRDPESRQRDAGGRSVPACCPHAPATRALLARWARTAADTGADVLFWDEPHFYLGAWGDRPAPPCCRCARCRDAWRNEAGGDLPEEGAPELERFRSRTLRGLLEESIAAAGTVRHALCLLPRGEFAGAGSDTWEELGQTASVARLATDPYWMDRPVEPADYVRTHAERLRRLCDATGREMEVWIQGIRIPRGAERRIVEASEAAAAAGADRIAFWSFRGTERMSSLACEDPDAAWAAMCEAVRRLS
jgi:hypothetical protein